MKEIFTANNPYLETITVTCSSGVQVFNAGKELQRIMRESCIHKGFVIHNDKKYEIVLTHPFDIKEVE